MQSVESVLFAYYVCDAIARQRPLSRAEARACSAAYEAVKVVHLTRDERRMLSGGPSRRAHALDMGERRFTDWVRRNPARVAALRAAAAPAMAPIVH